MRPCLGQGRGREGVVEIPVSEVEEARGELYTGVPRETRIPDT